MTLRELHKAAVRTAIPGTRGEAEWFRWWYMSLLKRSAADEIEGMERAARKEFARLKVEIDARIVGPMIEDILRNPALSPIRD